MLALGHACKCPQYLAGSCVTVYRLSIGGKALWFLINIK